MVGIAVKLVASLQSFVNLSPEQDNYVSHLQMFVMGLVVTLYTVIEVIVSFTLDIGNC